MGVPTPVQDGHLLRFDRLDTSGFTIPVYTVGWRILDQPGDVWTQRFVAFKADETPAFMGGAYVLLEATKELMARRNLKPASVGLAVALSSRATKLNNNHVLCRTGRWLAQRLNLTFVGEKFSKQAHRSLHTLSSSGERDGEVSGKYTCQKIEGVSTVIILDDFVTRGATLGEMKRALDETSCGISAIGLALGKHERNAYATGFGVNVSNEHIPDKWNQAWINNSKRKPAVA
ncbi:phosphoribosyltransferase [Sphingomonas turrisvirgatae]|uniref:phosphoribosyltransferase n=1 Tax=Sphingomonas turrisvirgatae TaxID=1888892 RepID=UPI00104229A0|nr:phosphoribosyltransferase [Sphingomonas turrisvirgatae]